VDDIDGDQHEVKVRPNANPNQNDDVSAFQLNVILLTVAVIRVISLSQKHLEKVSHSRKRTAIFNSSSLALTLLYRQK
jgi:hypothetical protein